MTRKLLLSGASALAILIASGAANADTFSTPGRVTFTASVSGEYSFEVAGAAGGGFLNPGPPTIPGGAGAEVSGDISLTAGEQLTLVVGGMGGGFEFAYNARGGYAAGGGGGSFIFAGTGTAAVNLLAAAGGGGGVGIDHSRGPGLASEYGGDSNGPQLPGSYSGLGGTAGSGGTGGNNPNTSFYANGGGGAGVRGAGGNGAGAGDGHSGYGGQTFPTPTGGAGADGSGNGGYGGGGGGGSIADGFGAAGGGGGYSGGGGGYSGGGSGNGGGGGGSFLSPLVSDGQLVGGQNPGDGFISIVSPTVGPAPVPEPSSWMMALTGFAGLGWLARLRNRKLTSG